MEEVFDEAKQWIKDNGIPEEQRIPFSSLGILMDTLKEKEVKVSMRVQESSTICQGYIEDYNKETGAICVLLVTEIDKDTLVHTPYFQRRVLFWKISNKHSDAPLQDLVKQSTLFKILQELDLPQAWREGDTGQRPKSSQPQAKKRRLAVPSRPRSSVRPGKLSSHAEISRTTRSVSARDNDDVSTGYLFHGINCLVKDFEWIEYKKVKVGDMAESLELHLSIDDRIDYANESTILLLENGLLDGVKRKNAETRRQAEKVAEQRQINATKWHNQSVDTHAVKIMNYDKYTHISRQKKNRLLRQLSQMKPCAMHKGSKDITLRSFFAKLIGSLAENRNIRFFPKGKNSGIRSNRTVVLVKVLDSIEQLLPERKRERVRGNVRGNVNNRKTSLGRIKTFAYAMNPVLEGLELLEADQKTVVTIRSLSDRLVDAIENPWRWIDLHGCGNGFNTYGCRTIEHGGPGTAELNAAHQKLHDSVRLFMRLGYAHEDVGRHYMEIVIDHYFCTFALPHPVVWGVVVCKQ